MLKLFLLVSRPYTAVAPGPGSHVEIFWHLLGLTSCNQRYSVWCFQDETEHDEPPSLPPRNADFFDSDAPPLPERSAGVEEVEDDGEYEELAVPSPPPALSGLSQSRPSVKRQTFSHMKYSIHLFSFTAVDYEDMSCGVKAVALYDYQGGMTFLFLFFFHNI